MHPPQYCPHVLDLPVKRRAIAISTAKFRPPSRFEKHRRFQKDIQAQIGKPQQWETITKSKTRHVDGGGRNPRVHGRLMEHEI